MHVRYPAYPAVGNIEAEFFEAPKWKPQYPNPAFNRMDTADAFWAASLVSRFTDEMIRAIVAAGKISDPEAAAYLTEVLITRRDKVVHYWISRTNPLDRFDVQRRADSGLQLTFDNAAVRVGAAPKAPATACGGRPWTTSPVRRNPGATLNWRERRQASHRPRGVRPTIWGIDMPLRPLQPCTPSSRTGRSRSWSRSEIVPATCASWASSGRAATQTTGTDSWVRLIASTPSVGVRPENPDAD